MKCLTPIFDQIPPELCALSRWVCWKRDKVPYCASAVNSTASPTDPDTWEGYDQAKTAYEEGGCKGVGFVLNGDGIVGIDIDHCVIDGKPLDAAMKIMDDIGCQYVELSPSGTGLHGFGYAHAVPTTGRRGVINGVHIELYSWGRYLTMTGHALKAGPLAHLSGYLRIYDQLRTSIPTEETEVIEATECNTSISSVSIELPSHLTPTTVGQRNKKIFELARHLKVRYPDASFAELKPVVKEWHRRALPVIGTKDFGISWAEFKTSWRSVKYFPETLTRLLVDLPKLPVNCPASEYGPKGLLLFQICVGLQEHEGAKPFFISSRKAGELIGCHASDAAKLLKAFCIDGLIEEVSKGVGKVASRYRIVKAV